MVEVRTNAASPRPKKRRIVAEIMTARVPLLSPGQTARNAHELLRREAENLDSIHDVYVVDDGGRLIGAIPLHDLYRFGEDKPLGTIARSCKIVLVPADPQEKAADAALKHGLKSVPVIGADGRFVGVVTSEALLAILHWEARRDLLQMSGVHPGHVAGDNILEIPLMLAVRHRLPWLLIGLLGGLLTAHVVSSFEKTLRQHLILANFIPLLVYMADAVGTQMEAFAIRDFTVFRDLDYRRYFFKQMGIVLMTAALLSLCVLVAGFALRWDYRLALTINVGLFLSILSSVFTGLLVPYLFRMGGIDPANASGPIATIVQDFLSVVIYFVTASWVLRLP